MALKTPAPGGRRAVLTFASPAIDDLIFWELRDSRLPENTEPPEYGTPHPDGNRWPKHKLIYITPAAEEEDGWQRWFYAAAREDQDDYNFELDGDEFLVRTYIVPRSEYLDDTFVEPAVGTADSVFTEFLYCGQNVRRIGQQELDSYFVVIQRNYANTTTASSLNIAEAGTPRGEETVETTIGATAAASALATGLFLARNSRLSENDSWENSVTRLSVRTGVNRQTTQYTPGISRVSSDELVVGPTAPTGAVGEVGFTKELVTVDTDGNDALWRAQRETIDNNPATGSMMVRELGGGIGTIAYDMVSMASGATGGFLVLESQVDPVGNGQAVRKIMTIDSYPTLIEDMYDETMNAIIRITKDVVVPGSVTGSVSAGDITEIKPVDKWRSIRIRSQLLSGAVSSTLPFVYEMQLPPVLRAAEFKYVAAWATASGNYDFAEDLTLVFDIQEAYSTSLEGRILRSFSSSPAAVSVPSEIYRPESHTITYASAWWYASGSSPRANANIREWHTPVALCSGITVSLPPWFSTSGLTVNREYSNFIPATAAYPMGWTTIGVESRPTRLGYYEILEKQVNLPALW